MSITRRHAGGSVRRRRTRTQAIRQWARDNGYDPSDSAVWRPFTDFFMEQLVELSGYPYCDAYAADVKKSLEAGNGYPEGTEPPWGWLQ